MMKLSRRTFTKLVAAAPFFSGTSLATAATPSGTVIIARNLDSTRTLDPHEVYEIAPSEFIRSMYSRIVDLDNETFSKVVPGVAKSWEASDNGRTYTFTIDTNQKFHSGRNVTAEDVAWSLRRAATLGRRVSFMIAQFGLNKDTAEKNIRAEGDKVIVTLDKSYAPNLFLNVLTTTNGAVVDKDLVLQHEKDGDLGNGWLRTNAAGGGAYMLQSYTPKEAAVLKANPDFYLGAPKTDTIIVRNVNEPGSQLLLLEKGDIDIAQDLTADQISGLEGNKDVKVTSIPVGTVFYLALNLSHPTLSKPAVWEALRYLVDYDALCNNLFEGTYSVAQSFLAPGVNGSIGTQPYHFDPEKAKALLAEAGYPDGFELAMDVRPSDPYQATAQAIQATFAQAGIKLALNVSEPVSYMTKIRKGDFEFMMYSKTLDYNDPNAMASYFAVNDETTPKAPEWTHWKVPEEMAKKTEEAAAEQDPQKRDDLYKEIQEEIQRKSPFIFMFRQLTRVSMRANVSGFRAGSPFDSGIYYLIEKSAS